MACGPYFATGRRQIGHLCRRRGTGVVQGPSSVHPPANTMSSIKPGRGLLVAAMLAILSGPAVAQNLDQDKPAPKLFAESCAACHKNARGLAKGRFRLTLYMFLQDHYASNSSSAWALTNYLGSLDAGKRGPTRAAAKPATTARTSLRPPAPVPTR